MISPGTAVFLQIPEGPCHERLYRGSVSDFHCGICTIEFTDPTMTPETGQQVLVHYERDNEFVRQAAVVQAMADAIVDLRITGEAVSAERRREPRVSYLHVLQRVVREPMALLSMAVSQHANPLHGHE